MTYKDILEHCKHKVEQLKDYKDSKGSKLYRKYHEHRMIAELIERAEVEGKCHYIDSGTIGITDGLYKPECARKCDDDDFFPWNAMRHFKFCPYCGRKIEVVEE